MSSPKGIWRVSQMFNLSFIKFNVISLAPTIKSHREIRCMDTHFVENESCLYTFGTLVGLSFSPWIVNNTSQSLQKSKHWHISGSAPKSITHVSVNHCPLSSPHSTSPKSCWLLLPPENLHSPSSLHICSYNWVQIIVTSHPHWF